MEETSSPGVAALRAALAARRMPLAELERRIGVAYGTVSHWLAGRQRPSLHGALQLQRLLGIDASIWETSEEAGRRVQAPIDSPALAATGS